MKTSDVKLLPSHYYHIYNRGINGGNIFFEKQNYTHFLTRWAKYVEPVAETYAYCLLRNHFHILVRIRDLDKILGLIQPDYPADKAQKIIDDPSRYISYQFGHALNSYAKSINNKYKRTGSLLEERFERILIDNERYYQNLIDYIHKNPERHRFVESYKDYPYSSFNSHLSIQPTLLMRDAVLSLFGGANEYKNFHRAKQDDKAILPYIFEEDD